MVQQDRLEFVKIMQMLGVTFDRQISDLLLDAYFAALSDLPIDSLKSASAKWLHTGKFFPRPAELREFCEGNADDRAQLAWETLVKAVRRFGAYKSLYVAEPILAAAIRETWGDWPRLCETLPLPGDPMFVSDQKRFLASYRLCELRRVEGHPWLPGLAECHNRQNTAQMLRSGDGEYVLSVAVIERDYTLIEKPAAFDRATGTLTAEAKARLLNSAPNLQLTAAQS